ncbi:MAG: NAD(P)/FAD-dependent oxidoreductase [Clostridiales bacterium]|jgi:predicted Rossmann fold flavoprotein|nr:NAD(P)/FAD-dependent oxidoreductase [Clostridiales bacterium]
MTAAVIGGGPAGVFAAAFAAKNGVTATLFDGNEKLLKKLYISGKGRCNLTNDCAPDEFLSNVVNGKRFLISAIAGFTPSDALGFFAESGLPLKTERGGRVFPSSDKSSDVIKTLERLLRGLGAEILTRSPVSRITKDETAQSGAFTVVSNGEKRRFDRVVIATGGASYSATGSAGGGYVLAAAFGHRIIEQRPALCALRLKEDVGELEGLALKNVSVSAETDGRTAFSEFGEALFTADGLSGPSVLSLSSRINRFDGKKTDIVLDLKPALTRAELDARILRDFKKYANKNFANSLDGLLPKSLIAYVVRETKIPPDKKVNEISRAERAALLDALKGLRFGLKGLAPLDSAIVTSGGVDTSQINPKTMESKLVPGLFFAGEVMDVDALTGGFNIHIAMATGRAAGRACAGGLAAPSAVCRLQDR